MAFTFKKASKEQAKLRCAMFGPSGSGKTYTSLRVATGIKKVVGGKIAVIDTERGSASKYADRFDFDVLELDDTSITNYTDAMKAAGDKGYSILIIDSMSHAWKDLLQEVEKLAQAKYRGNTWSAWSEGTPKQQTLVDGLLNYPGHVIATMRSKTEWETTKDTNGKSRPVRVGLAPEQGKGVEYEFDLLCELTTEHVASFIKDRTGKYQDKIVDKPGEKFGEELANWLMDATPPADPMSDPKTARTIIVKAMNDRSWNKDHIDSVVKDWLSNIDAKNLDDTTMDQRCAFVEDINKGAYDVLTVDITDALKQIEDAKNLDELAVVYRAASLIAKSAGDMEAVKFLTEANDTRKAELSEPVNQEQPYDPTDPTIAVDDSDLPI